MDGGVWVRRLGERRRFVVIDSACLGNTCFDPCVLRDERGKDVPTCLTRARNTCPSIFNRGHDDALLRRRMRQGWLVDGEE